MKYPLTDHQQHLLRSLIPGLKDGSIASNWFIRLEDDGIGEIYGLDKKVWDEVWNTVTYADLDVFVEYRFLMLRRKDKYGAGVEYGLNAGLIVQAVENDFEDLSKGNSIQIVANHSIVNVQSALTNVQQTLSVSQSIDPEMRQQLVSLIDQLKQELSKVPVDKDEEAEAIVASTQTIVEQLDSGKPNRRILEISKDGMIKAAQDVTTVASLLMIANQIAHLIQPLIAR